MLTKKLGSVTKLLRGSLTPTTHWSIFDTDMPNHLNTPKTQILGALVIAGGLQKFGGLNKNWKSKFKCEMQFYFCKFHWKMLRNVKA